MQQLHWAELPTAALAQLTQNLHIEGKPPPLEQFCFFRQQQPGERPPADAGAAMLELIRRQLFPGFALAFYEHLSAAGQNHPIPSRLALVAEDAIMLAPAAGPGGWQGFLIAESQAAGQDRAFRWIDQPADQPSLHLAVPAPASAAMGAVWAEEAACLAIQPSPDTHDSPGSPLP
jgi:hypothetical protein